VLRINRVRTDDTCPRGCVARLIRVKLGGCRYVGNMVILLVMLLVLVVVLPFAGWALWLLVSAALVGAIIGGLARLVLPGRQEIGFLSTVLIGWIGSLVGSLIGRHLFHVGTMLTLLCEVAVAAIVVPIASSGAGNAVAHRNSSLRR
jgi:uncharacterized membrane protein YeaQ/YmgE (transglycosylase-associated protein family)